MQDFLIRNERLGESLAMCFAGPDADSVATATAHSEEPYHCVTLMRGHGFTVLASNIEQCVYRAIYTQENAVIQYKSLVLSAAHHERTTSNPGIRYLDKGEAEASAGMSRWAWTRAWELWVREVEVAGLYRSRD
jgi:ribulose-5-phosphate 4-epimerase/fuculose-1-phosphate aldolase